MKFAILGGSFNPVHVGHLYLADTVLVRLGYHRVILIPAFQSPFKVGVDSASPRDRLDMLAASIAGDPRLTVDDCEIKREGVSYTIDTIEDIRERYRPEGKLGLILGDDLADSFHQWRRAGDIAKLTEIIIARRLFGAQNQKEPSYQGVRSFPYPYTELDNEVMNVSSRLVREKIRQGENWRYLVPSGARDIIEDRGLFGLAAGLLSPAGQANDPGEDPAIMPDTIVAIEMAARKLLSPSRFLHSRNTAVLAWDLCLRFKLDPRKGYLAGLAHDICKSMTVEELVSLVKSDGGAMTKLEKEKPSLLHGRAAAVLLKKQYAVHNEDILDAVRHHTTGTAPGDLVKVIYIADKFESSREGVNGDLREMIEKADLDTLFTAALDSTVAYLRSQKMDISPGTLRLLSAMQGGTSGAGPQGDAL
jgi:nicotinate-nucleotide adenylyltransferase